MLKQLFDIVKQFGQNSVVNNPQVPNQYNQEVMADATQTIAGGFKNILAGGGFRSILDLFKMGGNSSRTANASGIGGLIKNPIVSMMIGYFVSKLVRKYSMSPAAASNVANNLIPDSLNGLIQQTNDPNNEKVTLDGLIGSLVGRRNSEKQEENGGGGTQLQDLLDKFTGGGNPEDDGSDLENINGKLREKSQNSFEDEKSGGGGLMDLIKGFFK